MTVDRVLAVGGVRTVPAPDAIAREYLLLSLRLDQHVPGIADGYFGPANLKAIVDMEQRRPLARLADDASELRARLASEVRERDRRRWLELQLVALETLARDCTGEAIPYSDLVGRCFAHAPARRPESRFEAAAAELDDRLPGDGPLGGRLTALDAAWTIPAERVAAVVAELVGRFRERAAALFDLPPGEDLRVSLVRNQPWSGYNWYDGAFRSRVDINLDLPIRLPALIGTVAHETYPGHHLEHAVKEQVLVEGESRLEASILLINTPECLISEGLANLGRDLAVPPSERADLLVELAPLAGLPIASDPGALREAAELHQAAASPRVILGETGVNAALMRHVDGASHADVLAYLVDVGRVASETAAKQLEFIEHPLWRTYVFVYTEGEALLRRWLDLAPVVDRAARFGRLLREPLTPPAIEAEIAAGA